MTNLWQIIVKSFSFCDLVHKLGKNKDKESNPWAGNHHDNPNKLKQNVSPYQQIPITIHSTYRNVLLIHHLEFNSSLFKTEISDWDSAIPFALTQE